MSKKLNRLFGIVLAALFVTTSCISSFAYANGTAPADVPATNQALYSVLAERAPSAVNTVLAKAEVDVDDDALIEVLPLNKTGNESVLVVTKENDTTVTKELILSVAGDGTINDASDLFNSSSMNSRAGGATWLPWEDGTLVRAVAVYNKYLGSPGYYQPQSCYFIYYDNGVDLITYVSLAYKCHGFEYTYPGYEPLYDDDFDTYEHTIRVRQNNPAYNTMYLTENPYRSDRIICTNGGWGTGQVFEFTITINGRTVGNTVAFIENAD